MFQLYFMIFLTVTSLCSFIIAILARSAQSGFVYIHAAILLYFELVVLIFGCQDVIRRVPHGSCRHTQTVVAHYLINVVYTFERDGEFECKVIFSQTEKSFEWE